jgi:hypothetical protein
MRKLFWQVSWDSASESRLLDVPSPSRTDASVGDTVLWDIGELVECDQLYSSVINRGKKTDIEFTSRSVVLVPDLVRSMLLELDNLNVQFVPVAIDGDTQPKFAVNTLTVAPCFDWQRSDYDVWPETERPSRAGLPRSVIDLRVDPVLAPDTPLFRVAEYSFNIIITDDVKARFQRAKLTGAKFFKA